MAEHGVDIVGGHAGERDQLVAPTQGAGDASDGGAIGGTGIELKHVLIADAGPSTQALA